MRQKRIVNFRKIEACSIEGVMWNFLSILRVMNYLSQA